MRDTSVSRGHVGFPTMPRGWTVLGLALLSWGCVAVIVQMTGFVFTSLVG